MHHTFDDPDAVGTWSTVASLVTVLSFSLMGKPALSESAKSGVVPLSQETEDIRDHP
jgi:hypothetical protein